jgi:hypothetical protein
MIDAIIKYIVFAMLMIVALVFIIHGDMLLGTLFLIVSAIFAAVFLTSDNDDSNIYKLT